MLAADECQKKKRSPSRESRRIPNAAGVVVSDHHDRGSRGGGAGSSGRQRGRGIALFIRGAAPLLWGWLALLFLGAGPHLSRAQRAGHCTIDFNARCDIGARPGEDECVFAGQEGCSFQGCFHSANGNPTSCCGGCLACPARRFVGPVGLDNCAGGPSSAYADCPICTSSSPAPPPTPAPTIPTTPTTPAPTCSPVVAFSYVDGQCPQERYVTMYPEWDSCAPIFNNAHCQICGGSDTPPPSPPPTCPCTRRRPHQPRAASHR